MSRVAFFAISTIEASYNQGFLIEISCFLFGLPSHFVAQPKDPFLNPLHTKLTKVKEIPYYVSNKFLRTYHRNAYQLGQVERMVEGAYENYLTNECKKQRSYKKTLETNAKKQKSDEEQQRGLKQASEFELTRCTELYELFPSATKANARRY
jgi:hypothetical protein